MSSFGRQLEYSDGGYIGTVDNKSMPVPIFAKSQPRRNDRPQILDGVACFYGVEHKHLYKGRVEAFEKGCFAESLWGITFLTNHRLQDKPLGDTKDNSLELYDSDDFLAFRLHLKNDDLDRLDGMTEMSPSYIEHDIEFRKVNGETIRVIKKASLIEISGCKVASMRKTFSVVRDLDSVGTLAEEVKTNFAGEAAAIEFKRALGRLQ